MACETKAWTVCCVALMLCLLVLTPDQSFAQSFTVLHTFSQTSGGNPNNTPVGSNLDGANPQHSLVISDSMLYGTTWHGGKGSGVVFGINTNGGGFTNLHSFSPTSGGDNVIPKGTNADGALPLALLVSGNTLYGTVQYGGAGGYGAVFKLNTDGTRFTTLYSFTNGNDGANPSSLVLSGDKLYGLSIGLAGAAVVYDLGTNGAGFIPLYQSAANYDPYGLALSGDNIYFVTDTPAYPYNPSTIFELNTNGMNPETLWDLDPSTNGADVYADLIIENNVLYGAAGLGGPGGSGTVFSISTLGSEFKVLHAFTPLSGNPPTNTDGAFPVAPLVLSERTLFGAARGGGTGADNGTLYQVGIDGTGFNTLHTFSAFGTTQPYGNCDGGYPWSELVLTNNTLYGTCFFGGAYGSGTIFAVNLTPTPIPLNVEWTNNSVVLSWTNAAFNLQSAPTVSGVYTNVPGASSPYTNATTGSQMFFRLVAD